MLLDGFELKSSALRSSGVERSFAVHLLAILRHTVDINFTAVSCCLYALVAGDHTSLLLEQGARVLY